MSLRLDRDRVLATASLVSVLIAMLAVVLSVVLVTRAVVAPTPVWRHGDVAYWQRWLGEVCHAAEAKPHINRFDERLTIYETRWESDPTMDAPITSVDCTMTWLDGKPGPRTLVVLLTNTRGQLPGYAVMETATAVARELTGDGAGVVTDLATGPSRAETRSRMTASGGYAQPWQWSMRVVVRD